MEKIHAPTEKPINELQEQITKVEERVGRGIIPPRGKELELSQMERAYPARYRHFVNVLLSIKNPKYSSENTDRSVKMLKVLDNLQDQLLRMESGVDKVLLPRQAVTFKKIASFLESGNTEGNITLPTGLGKTVIFSKLFDTLFIPFQNIRVPINNLNKKYFNLIRKFFRIFKQFSIDPRLYKFINSRIFKSQNWQLSFLHVHNFHRQV